MTAWTQPPARPVILDDTALLALGAGHQLLSGVVARAHLDVGHVVYAPAMCVFAATSSRPALGDHIGGLVAIRIMDLGLADALGAAAAVAAGVPWERAHALTAARPSAQWPEGLTVLSHDPVPYRRFGLEVVDIG
ncbi:hypothetical protein ACIB24_00975 [Spongisporangium articulatum]|uniref:DUF3168 domain-containing protein n=1 Tax=Spongisporangium articulatum TaxID=3362603 RepID=A0ABW8AGZ7_9ACTN